jgi:hypothetical protein
VPWRFRDGVVEFNVCLDFLKLLFNFFVVIFSASEVDEGFVGLFWAIFL